VSGFVRHNSLRLRGLRITIGAVCGAQRASTRVAPDAPLRRDSAYARHRAGVKFKARSPEGESHRGGVEGSPGAKLQSLGSVRGARSGRQGKPVGEAVARTNAQKGNGGKPLLSWARSAALLALLAALGFGGIREVQMRLILNGAGWSGNFQAVAQRASTRVAPDAPLRPDRAYARHRAGVTF
jgi:hypothetical protein